MNCFPRRAAGVLSLVLVLAAAGCGGDDDTASDAYVSDVGTIQSQFVSAYQRLASEVTASSPSSDDAAVIDKLSGTLSQTVTRLREVDVPQAVREQHEELAAILEDYRDDLTKAAEGLVSGSEARRARAQSQLEKETGTLSQDFSRKITEINTRLRE